MMERSQPLSRAAFRRWVRREGGAVATAGAAAARVSCQNDALACGSRSKTAVFFPSASAATAKAVARVVFPTPPF